MRQHKERVLKQEMKSGKQCQLETVKLAKTTKQAGEQCNELDGRYKQNFVHQRMAQVRLRIAQTSAQCDRGVPSRGLHFVSSEKILVQVMQEFFNLVLLAEAHGSLMLSGTAFSV